MRVKNLRVALTVAGLLTPTSAAFADDMKLPVLKPQKALNVMWRADADFLAETYKGSDTDVTQDGLMCAQVTTFGAATLKFKL